MRRLMRPSTGGAQSLCMLQAQALRGLYTLWYAAGETLSLLPTLPTQQKDILPAFAADLPISTELSIKDGRLGYTNKTLTWQVQRQPSHPLHCLMTTKQGLMQVCWHIAESIWPVSCARAALAHTAWWYRWAAASMLYSE